MNINGGRFLISGGPAGEFNLMISHEAGRKATLGDPGRIPDVKAGAAILRAHSAVVALSDAIQALAKDRTRSEPESHAAAGVVAGNTARVLEISHAEIVERAKALEADGYSEADDYFASFKNRAFDLRVAEYIRETAGRDGTELPELKKLALEDSRLGRVVYEASHYILGLSEHGYNELRFSVMQKYVPSAYGRVVESIVLSGEYAPKYPKAIQRVRYSTYNPEIAKAASTRASIPGIDS